MANWRRLTCTDRSRVPVISQVPDTGRGLKWIVPIEAGGFYPRFYGILISRSVAETIKIQIYNEVYMYYAICRVVSFPMTLSNYSRSRHSSTSNKSLKMEDNEWSIEVCQFQWFWMTANPDFKGTLRHNALQYTVTMECCTLNTHYRIVSYRTRKLRPTQLWKF